MRLDKNKNAGFTLVETLVVVFIIGLLSTILIVNWRQNEKQYQLQMAAQEIVQNIRKVQGMALNGSRYNNQIPFNYGLDFDLSSPNSYIIFANQSNDRRYDVGNDLIVGDTAVQIESGFEIGSLVGSTGVLTVVDTTFSMPDGFVTIRKDQPTGGSPWQNSLTITVRKIGTTCPSKDCKNIVIMDTGQINIQ